MSDQHNQLNQVQRDIASLNTRASRIERVLKRIERAIPLLARMSQDKDIQGQAAAVQAGALRDLRGRRAG